MRPVNFKRMWHIGIHAQMPPDRQRNTMITNIVAMVFAGSSTILGCYIYLAAGYFRPMAWIFLPLIALFLLPLLLNHLGQIFISRIVLSCVPSTMVLLFSIQAKLSIADLTFNDYYNFRIALIALCTIPFLLFSLNERWPLVISSLFCFMALFLSDQIHHLFNVGFYDIGFEDRHYDFINFNSIVACLAIMLCILSLKRIIEKQEKENTKLMSELQASHEEVMSQRDELITQGELLNDNQKKLTEAYAKVEKHTFSLEEELALYDSEITQFSYNVCHHLRGPVASLSGLIHLYAYDGTQSRETLIPYFQKGISDLEGVVADLNYVLQIRRELFHQRTQLSLTKVFWEVQSLLGEEISQAGAVVKMDFERAPLVQASKMALISIFNNLLSNALKFRDESTKPVIEVSAYPNYSHQEMVLEIRDNGIGIDLSRYRDDLFKMYKRFHQHREGKGLGLYLVRLQVSALGGSIEVESAVNEYTKFIIRLPYPFHDN